VTAPHVLAKQEPDHRLLSTKALAHDIRVLQSPMDDADVNPRADRPRVAALRRKVGDFIILQIEAYPSISPCELEKQLALAFAVEDQGCGETLDREEGVPRVFAPSWGPKSTQRNFAVVYSWWASYGGNGSQTILESYVWEKDQRVHRAAASVPASFAGMLLRQAQEVCWFPDPDRYWVLLSESVGGGSGRVIGGTASVVEIGPDQIRTIWNAPPGIGNLEAYAMLPSLRWEIEYADVQEVYADQPKAYRLEIYQVDFERHAFHRLAYLRLDPE